MKVKVLLAVVVLIALATIAEGRKLKRKWVALGCYKDNPDRAMKYFIGLTSGRSLQYRIRQCIKKAHQQHFEFIGLQNRVECWGSYKSTHDKYGCAKNCYVKRNGKYGAGRNWTNFVYHRKKDWTPCNCNDPTQYKLDLIPDTGPNCPKYNRKVVREFNKHKPCVIKGPCPVDGSWSMYGPWSTCNKLCGKGGKQFRKRECNNPEPDHGGKDCVGKAMEYSNCNNTNCPTPCSFDGLLIQLLNNLSPGVTINNHLVKALSQVVYTIDDTNSLSTVSNISDAVLMRRLKDVLDLGGEDEQARTILGLLLSKNNDCNYVKSVNKIKKEIGNDALKKIINTDGDVTMTFTIDETGSMRKVIEEAKAIAKSIAGYKGEWNVNYVLSTFGEVPRHRITGKVQTFQTLNEFLNALESISTYGGADCSEPTYAGIIRGIGEGHPKLGSPMYVFTDAPPKTLGNYTLQRAIDMARSNKVPVTFFLTDGYGFCRYQKPRPKDSPGYKAIIDKTGGVGLNFINSTYMSQIKPMIEADLDGTSTVVSGTLNIKDGTVAKRSSSSDKEFIIENVAKTLNVFAKVNTDVRSGVKLLNPKGDEIRHEWINGEEKTWVILLPSPGTWKFKIGDDVKTFTRTVKVSAELDITFTPTFMRNGQVIPHPLIGEKATVKIHIPNLSRLTANSLKFHLVSTNEEKSMEKDDGIFESHLPSGDQFKIRLTGKTLSGYDFQRESNLVQPKLAVMRALSSFIELTVDKPKYVKFAIEYSGLLTKTFTIKVTTDSHVRSQVQSHVIVPGGGTKEIPVKLTANEGRDVDVKIEAISGDLVISWSKRVSVYDWGKKK